ncbi:MAG: fused MFS/spermidine synthase [Planctomycetota bacterium]|jgi:spermidine synthase
MRLLVLVLFVLSGACGLLYEVVWTRLMVHVFGSTSLAVGTVLAAFMSGLAAGSWLIGRAADKSSNPLRLYARLEFGVGLGALIAHLLLVNLAPINAFVYELSGGSQGTLAVARFVLAFVLVMAPTMLMGATLPVLARWVATRPSSLGSGLSTLYALNTVGAVAGTLLCGFVLIGALGLDGTVALAVGCNLAIGLIAWSLSARVPSPGVAVAGARDSRAAGDDTAPAPAAVSTASAPGRLTWWLLCVGLGLSGLTSFAYEILWTRSLVFLLGNSTYAVTTMLTAFLSGIALGGWLVRFVLERVPDRTALFGWLQVAIALTAIAALPSLFALSSPEALRISLGVASHDVGQLLLTRFGVALLVMVVPATLIGATFPLVGRIGAEYSGGDAAGAFGRTGAYVGRIYAVNTFGNVLGALLPGLVLLSWLGIQRSLLVMAGLNATVGFAVLLTRVASRPRRARVVVPALLAVVILSGIAPLSFRFPAEHQTEWHRVLYYGEGPSATTMVLLDPEKNERSMAVDGVEIGGNMLTEYKQLLLAHLPKLLLTDVSPELSIGLGSGMLAGESLAHDRVERLVCVEIEPTVIAGAAFFDEASRSVLRDERCELVMDDVANHLRTTTDRYRVISADEKTALEYASNGFSYSREYYRLLADRLAPGGLVVQWVPTSMPPRQFRIVLRTFSEAFPHVLVFYCLPALKEGAANTILVGAHEPPVIDLERARELWAGQPEAWESLARYGIDSPESLLAQVVSDGQSLRAAVADAPTNTVDRPRYEFYSPAEYAVSRVDRLAVNDALLRSLRAQAAPRLLERMGVAAEGSGRMARAWKAEGAFLSAFALYLVGRSDEQELLGRFDAALEMAPWNQSLAARVALQYWMAGTAQASFGNLQLAAERMARSLSLHGKGAIDHVVYATILLFQGRTREAIDAARTATRLDPRLVAARRVLADALLADERTDEARRELEALLAIEPDDAQTRALLGLP